MIYKDSPKCQFPSCSMVKNLWQWTHLYPLIWIFEGFVLFCFVLFCFVLFCFVFGDTVLLCSPAEVQWRHLCLLQLPPPGFKWFSYVSFPSNWDYRHPLPHPANFCIFSKQGVLGLTQWLRSVIPALWETKVGRSWGQEFQSSLTNMMKPCLYKIYKKIRWAWWQAPVIPATREAEAGGSLELRRVRLQWNIIMPLHYSLGEWVRHLKN